MALNLTRTYTYTAGNTIASSENNTNENTIYNAFAGLEAGTASMSKLPLDADPTSALHAATKQYVDVYATWKRPTLIRNSNSTVDIDDNTGTAHQTRMLFGDGNYRTVTEDTSSTNKYRRFDITATAEFTTGTEDSGLRSGLSEASNTWYAIYAVKSLINSANFVLVGDTTLPLQASYSTLNSRYGTNSWVYLGLIRNGDGSGAASDIVDFVQHGNYTCFSNNTTTSVGNTSNGLRLANTAGATSLTWAYSAGTGTSDVPGNVLSGVMSAAFGSSASRIRIRDAGPARDYAAQAGGSQSALIHASVPLSGGIRTEDAAGNSLAMDILLVAYFDLALGVGSNPLI